jgi:hypothetical protein
MLEGHRVSLLESQLLFGVQNLNAELKRIKQDGFNIVRETVPMAKVLRRINEYTICKPPAQLPIREILVAEYWISR